MDYKELIPNNVNLKENSKLLRALERWHPRFLEWWPDQGPVVHQERDSQLLAAIHLFAHHPDRLAPQPPLRARQVDEV